MNYQMLSEYQELWIYFGWFLVVSFISIAIEIFRYIDDNTKENDKACKRGEKLLQHRGCRNDSK